ncbi:cerebellar degeneration-related protein 2-like [Genypterus blacodes]|uniref:cerebellar degeneration-related protein 2-like n=1 Tax=Genypterus blacodes TaxID=154954 RepID=UPI003F775B96
MLTDMIVEEEFELKEEEPWYDKRDLEHDLQLAAELGKTLLERNRELEQGLQQMYSTNQEQLQEIEYLTKQVDLLRQVNDQHAKVYEQLDLSARELEQSNHKLDQDNRAAQQKIHGLMETVELLQTQVDELQHLVDELKLSPPRPREPPRRETRRSMQSLSCPKDLQHTLGYSAHDRDDPTDDLELPCAAWHEEEQASLRRSLHTLQTQFASERARRAEAEREAELLANENVALEQQLASTESCQVRVSELEREAEELRQLWKSEASTGSMQPDAPHILLPNCSFLQAEEEGESEGEATTTRTSWIHTQLDSERLRGPDEPDRMYDHECSCVRRAEVVKYRGISLLNEVDAQYSALQVKYDELLRRCHQGVQEEMPERQNHKAIQTSTSSPSSFLSHSQATNMDDCQEDFHQPEYKELFKEIFSRIQKTKEDLIENRGRSSAGEAVPVWH